MGELTGPGLFSDAVQEFLRATDTKQRKFLARNRRADKMNSNVTDDVARTELRFPPPGNPSLGVLLLSAEQVAVPGYSAPATQTPKTLIKHGFKGTWKSSDSRSGP